MDGGRARGGGLAGHTQHSRLSPAQTLGGRCRYCPLTDERHRDREVGALPKATQLLRGGAQVWAQAVWLTHHCSFT